MAGQVDMLLGFDNLSHFPGEMDRKESLAQWSSEQGTGCMIAGWAQPGCTCKSCACTAMVNSVGTEHFHPSEFIRAEALGTNTPAQCTACCNFKECNFRADSIRQRVRGDNQRPPIGRGEKEVNHLVPILCLPLDPDRQLPPGQEVHGDPGVTPNQDRKAGGVQQPVL